jgi:hypothetical protein
MVEMTLTVDYGHHSYRRTLWYADRAGGWGIRI